jgi:hypothetical protein
MTVVGAGPSSSRGLILGRLAPQVKQIRSSCFTAAAQLGQVSVAIVSSWGVMVGGPMQAVFDARETNARGRADGARASLFARPWGADLRLVLT